MAGSAAFEQGVEALRQGRFADAYRIARRPNPFPSICGRVCAAGEVCSQGACALSCGGGTTLCGAACVNTQNDPRHCGACGTACPARANATAVCANGACGIASCNAGFGDCDGSAVNGCEADVSADVYAFDRANMLNGATARPAQRFASIPSLAGYGFQMVTPSTFYGTTAAPAGRKQLIARHRDDEAHDGASANARKGVSGV